MKYQEDKTYYIEWVDHCNDDGSWQSEVDIKPMLMYSVGWCVRSEKDYVVLAQNYYRKGKYRSTCAHMVILKNCIKKSKRIVLK